MFVPLGKEFERINEDDLKRMSPPIEFDTSRVKNKHLNVQYGTLPEQLLDIYLPDDADQPVPAVFYIHGGGWVMGTRRLGGLECIIGALKHGCAVISVEYRLAPGVCFPEFIFDVKTAVRWARAHAADYNLDPARFGIIGDSAGGHISLMMGFTADHPEYEGEQYGWAGYSSAVQAVVDMYGPADLAADEDSWYRESGVRRIESVPYGEARDKSLLEVAFGTDNRELLRFFSPISYVKEGIPPLLILQGHDDCVVPFQHSVLLAEKIRRICGPDAVELEIYPDCNHCDWEFYNEKTAARIQAFFDRHLK